MRLWFSKDYWVNPFGQVDKVSNASLHICIVFAFCWWFNQPIWLGMLVSEIFGWLYEIVAGCLFDFWGLVTKDGISIYDILCNNAGMMTGALILLIGGY